MKFLKTLLIIILLCAFSYVIVREVCRTVITVEAMRVGAPIFKTKPVNNQPAK